MYAGQDGVSGGTEDLQCEPWKGWPRPPAGFVDIGYESIYPLLNYLD